MGLVEIYETLIQTDVVLFEKQAAEIEKLAEEDAAGRIMGRGFLDELEKLADSGQAAADNLAQLEQQRRRYQAPPVQRARISPAASPSSPPVIAGQPGHLGMTQSISKRTEPTRLKMGPEKKPSAIAAGGLVDKAMRGARAQARWNPNRVGPAQSWNLADHAKPAVAKKKRSGSSSTPSVTLGPDVTRGPPEVMSRQSRAKVENVLARAGVSTAFRKYGPANDPAATALLNRPMSNAPGMSPSAPRMMPQAPSQKAFPTPSPRLARPNPRSIGMKPMA